MLRAEVHMSDEQKPPGESPTRAFQLKLDGWMSDILETDLDPNAPPAEAPADPAAPAAPRAAPQAPTEPEKKPETKP
jgi:hypothetical protein